eukprot:scaffold96600_cov51-Attheya_sp.AAC.1
MVPVTLTLGFKYLGGFVGSQAMQTEWIAEKVVEWEASVQILAKAARSCPQTSFAALQKSLQHEWQYLQRVTADIDADFKSVERAIQLDSLPALFGNANVSEDIMRSLTSLPVKFAGLSVPIASSAASRHPQASADCCSHLVDALMGRV